MSVETKVLGVNFKANNEVMAAVDKFHEGFASLKRPEDVVHYLIIITTLAVELMEDATGKELVAGMLHSLLDGERLVVDFEDMGILQ